MGKALRGVFRMNPDGRVVGVMVVERRPGFEHGSHGGQVAADDGVPLEGNER